jgi:ABC-type uncharacterized transport system YnjBCD substrate-binding protein
MPDIMQIREISTVRARQKTDGGEVVIYWKEEKNYESLKEKQMFVK